MRTFRLHQFGGSDQLGVEAVERPVPQAGELLVQVREIGVNPVDWKIREGYWRDRVQLPLTPGQDFAGEVAESGPNAPTGSKFRPGAQVFGFARGAYSEYAIAAIHAIALIPEGLSFESAAALPTPGLTADQILTRAAVRAGQRVLIHGAAGSVGSIAVQLAKLAGAYVIGTVFGDGREYVTRLGADRVIDAAVDKDYEGVGEPVDTVIDLVGGATQQHSWKLVRDGGILVSSVGLEGDRTEAQKRSVRAVAFTMKHEAAGLDRLGQLAADGELLVRIAKVLPFPQAPAAQDLVQNGHPHGKVLLRVA
ncbi:MAG TPA: NADP-dependent oxidoreductase [Terriglobales bacterium]|jgi:NADPH:quinone reductase-like Zn-dependent oxidoreductase